MGFYNHAKENRSYYEKEYCELEWGKFYDSFDEFFETILNQFLQSREIPTMLTYLNYSYAPNNDWWNLEDKQTWFYKDIEYEVDWGTLKKIYTTEHISLMIMEDYDKERKRFERLKRKFELSENEKAEISRPSIPERVRIEVWRRDEGKCVKCGSRERLEYDHIIPVSKGGSNTARNIELLCEQCNRKKGSQIN